MDIDTRGNIEVHDESVLYYLQGFTCYINEYHTGKKPN